MLHSHSGQPFFSEGFFSLELYRRWCSEWSLPNEVLKKLSLDREVDVGLISLLKQKHISLIRRAFTLTLLFLFLLLFVSITALTVLQPSYYIIVYI